MTPKIINIIEAEQVGDYCIRLRFDDDVEQTIDFKVFLLNSCHPDIRAFLEPSRFSSFRLAYGELVWGDYEMCFPMIDLYRNQINPITGNLCAA